MYRDHTKVIKIGNRVIGGGNPILIQSMTNTKTEDVEATVAQILSLEKAGCDIIRCAVPTMEAAKALSQIKKQIHIPLVADIHFDYRLAIAAMENGADKIRINPGNIGSKERIQAVVDTAKERNIPIRVGVNSICQCEEHRRITQAPASNCPQGFLRLCLFLQAAVCYTCDDKSEVAGGNRDEK